MDNYDDSNSAPVDIGFTFNYTGAAFNQFIINTNGFIKLGDIPPSDTVMFFTSPSGYTGTLGGIFSSPHFSDVFLLSPFNHDLQPGALAPEFRVYTSGLAGSRTCTIQFSNLQEKVQPPLRQFNNIEFQIILHETTDVIEFVYGNWQLSGNDPVERTAAIGLKGTSNNDNQLITVSTWYPWRWDQVDFYNHNYYADWYGMNFGQPPNPMPAPGDRFMFYPRQHHDAAVNAVYSMGKLPVPYALPHNPGAYIKNHGYDTLLNVPVSMVITGVNSYSGSSVVPMIKPDSGILVEFPGLPNLDMGYDQVKVSIPSDDFSDNNEKSFTRWINTDNLSYCDSMPYYYCVGFTLGVFPGSPAGLWLVKHHISGTRNIRSLKIGLGYGNGQSVYGVVLNATGQVIAQTSPFALTDSASWQYHVFNFSNPPVVADGDFYFGLCQTQSSETYLPMGLQLEEPVRPGAYYTAQQDGIGLTESGGDARYSIEVNFDSGYCQPTYHYGCSDPDSYNIFINGFSTSEGISNISNLNTGCSATPNNYSFLTDQSVSGEPGTSFKYIVHGGFQTGYTKLAVYADWNYNNDFSDTTELIFDGYVSGSQYSGVIDIPSSATPGLTRLRVVVYFAANPTQPDACGAFVDGETEDYILNILVPTPMTYLSGSVFQCDRLPPCTRGSMFNKIIGIRINTTGTLTPLQLSSFSLDPAGSDNFYHDVAEVRIYATGSDSAFSTSHLFGTSNTIPVAVNGAYSLNHGKNYFWVIYNLRDTATIGHYLDASCLSYTFNGLGSQVPQNNSPAGHQIIDYCIPVFITAGGCMGGVRISDFTTTGGLTNISNLNNGCPLNKYDYSKFSGQKVSVRQGDSFQFNITGTWHMAIYIDWNQDYDFSESNEMVSYNQLTGTITVPADAVAGNTRMRIICFYSPGPGVPPGGCGIPRRGETEDYLIEILPAVPVTVSVQNLTVGDGMDTCFNATQTLTVAGEGTTFLAQVGSNSTFIAGQMIRLLPTTTAQYGSYLHGYISSSGNYCWPLKSSSFLSQDDNQPGRHNAGNEVSGIVRIIPNPTFGEFIAEIEKAKKDCIVEAKIYSINGNLITSKNFPSGTRMAFSLMDLPDGLYFITLSTTERMFTGKILIQK